MLFLFAPGPWSRRQRSACGNGVPLAESVQASHHSVVYWRADNDNEKHVHRTDLEVLRWSLICICGPWSDYVCQTWHDQSRSYVWAIGTHKDNCYQCLAVPRGITSTDILAVQIRLLCLTKSVGTKHAWQGQFQKVIETVFPRYFLESETCQPWTDI